MVKRLLEYAENHTTPESDVLQALTQATLDRCGEIRMIAGAYQGRLLSMIAHMIQPDRILEIGAFSGYSSICFAEGLKPGASLTAIDNDRGLEPLLTEYWRRAGVSDRCEIIWGNARDVITTLEDIFDLVYIDADKVGYRRYYDLVFDKVRPGGFILFDNVFLRGHVFDADPKRDVIADMQQLNDFIQQDIRVENIMLPIRDGLMLVRKV